MKKSIVFFILTIGWLIEGCYEDKGHYDYIRISGPEVTGIEKFYTVYDGGNFDIHPSVTWTYGELENYTYSWKVDGISVSDKAELTEQVKDLPVKANMYAEFVITDEDTGVEYITQFRVTVSSVVCSARALSNGCKSRVSPNSGNYIAKGKGVHRELESERSRRQTSDLTYRNFIQGI